MSENVEELLENEKGYFRDYGTIPNVRFKVGDWVTISTTRKTEQVLDVDSNFVYTKTSYYKINLCELWKPQEGEWCWFSNGSHLVLARLSRTENDEFITNDTDMVGNCYYKYCEPFLGELPSFLK